MDGWAALAMLVHVLCGWTDGWCGVAAWLVGRYSGLSAIGAELRAVFPACCLPVYVCPSVLGPACSLAVYLPACLCPGRYVRCLPTYVCMHVCVCVPSLSTVCVCLLYACVVLSIHICLSVLSVRN